MRKIIFNLHVVIIILFNYNCQLSYSQSNTINVVSYPICNKITINFDSIKYLVPEDNTITFIIFRAEASTNPNGTISSLENQIASFNPGFFRILSFELNKTEGANYCKFYIYSGTKKDSTKVIPPRLWLITKNKEILAFMKTADFNLNAGLKFFPYKYDSSFLQLTGAVNNNEDFFEQFNKIITKLNSSFLIDYFDQRISHYSLSSDLALKNYEHKIDSLNQRLIRIEEKKIKDSLYKNNNELIEALFNHPLYYSFIDLDNNINYSIKNSYSFSAGYKYYPFSKSNWFGAGIELNFDKLSLDLFTNENITDTIRPQMIDIDGDIYDKIIYAKGIQENVSIQSCNITPHFSFRFRAKQIHPFWFFTINPGLKFNYLISSTYHAQEGELSYGGLYSYSNDTMFSGLYNFYQNQPVYDQQQQLIVKNLLISLYIPIDIYFKIPSTNLFITIGYYYEYGLTNILNNNPRDMIISYQPDNYNSILYRNSSVKVNSHGFKIGFAYKF